MTKIAFKTIGCRLNQAETEDLIQQFRQAGYQIASPKQASDCFVINTCSVTHVAARKSRQALREYKNRNPEAKIAVLGCAADELKSLPEIDLAIPNAHKASAFNSIGEAFDMRSDRAISKSDLTNRTRPLIKIQDGCDEYCTYCVVPFLRGKSRSIPDSEILAKIKKYEQAGAQEIILTGVHIGQYDTCLANLVKEILAQTKIPRIRLSSIEPQHLSDEILALFANPRICDFLHIPIQSGSDKILQVMQRKYSVSDINKLLRKIRRAIPNIFLATDIIVGFPGETDKDFLETYNFCEANNFAKMHVFSYSKREGTKAAKFSDQINPKIIRERSQKLRRLSDRLQAKYLEQFMGQQVEVLTETETTGIVKEGVKVFWDEVRKPNSVFLAQARTLVDNKIKVK
ncbi:tRNA (N(6)-L-threonylcarbamoyladenosine(37)-C(2))-methylthiotransferase MtaB [Patescibacteria group bacterium]